MQQDESALVKQALRDARAHLASAGKALPAAYMLVLNNPQTGAPLTHPTAIGFQREAPFATQAEYDEFIVMLRAEAHRLAARAIAIANEAQAEVEEGARLVLRRVLYLRVEDADGVHQMHAAIDAAASGKPTLGSLFEAGDAADPLDAPLLTRPSGG